VSKLTLVLMYFLQHRGLVGFFMYGSHEYTARPSRLMVSLAALRVSGAHLYA
jgi:hypothetical protein